MRIFRLIDFPEPAINHESQWAFQLSTSEILDHHNQAFFTSNVSYYLYVKGANDAVKILHKYNGLRRNNKLLIWNNVYFISQEKNCFCKIVFNIFW